MSADARPVLLVTNLVAPDRAGAFQALHERENVELALFGGRSHHATAAVDDPGVPHRAVTQREVYALAASGRYRAVIAGTAGRTALPAAWAGARRARVPFLLWTALWAHPRTAAFTVAGTPLLRTLYRRADAIITYGPHVSAFVAQRGARNVHVAPQAVDVAFWSGDDPAAARATRPDGADFVALYVGRAARYKGIPELEGAWRLSGFGPPAEALTLVGETGIEAVHRRLGFTAPAAGSDQAAQLLRRRGRPGDVGHRDPRLPRALGAGRQRSHAPTTARHRHHRRRRRRRRPRAPRAQRPGRPRRGHRRARRRAPHAARGSRPAGPPRRGRRADAAAYTFDAWAAGVSSALVSVGAAQEGDR